MYIHRIITHGVPGLRDRDDVLFDDWAKEPLKSVLITGPNGTGKTTLLRVIAGLWDKLNNLLPYPNVAWRPDSSQTVLISVRLAAIEIRGLIGQPLWIYEAGTSDPKSKEFVEQEAQKTNGVVIGGIQAALISGEELTNKEWFKKLASSAQRLQMGAGASGEVLPNMVLLESGTRQINIPEPYNNFIQPEALYRWLVTYSGAERTELHLERMLSRLKVRDPKWFDDTLRYINIFLEQNGKRVTDFDGNLRLMVETEGHSRSHYIDRLSSGEQQCLILIFMISRWLMDGGVVLIDEPDLHMHVSWQRQLIHELERLVAEKHGQLIVTSHSPTLWEEYNERQRINFEVAVQP